MERRRPRLKGRGKRRNIEDGIGQHQLEITQRQSHSHDVEGGENGEKESAEEGQVDD